MWVRSQNKCSLIDAKGCFINQHPYYGDFGPDEEYKITGFMYCAPAEENEFYLGTYKTLKKAILVLDELQCRIARTESGVYQMPEDE